MEDLANKNGERKTELHETAARELYSAARWAMGMGIFLIIFGILITLSIISIFYTIIISETMPPQIVGTMFVLIFLIPFSFVLTYFLFSFSKRIKKALLTNSDADFYSGFKALKRYFSLTVIISFALTGLTFLISFIIGFATAMQEIH